MPERDARMEAVLRRAAEDAAFLERLLADREATIASCDLTEPERALLCAASEAQLRAMAKTAAKVPWYEVNLPIRTVAATAALLAVGSAMIPCTLGHTRELAYEEQMRSHLRMIHQMQAQYRQEFGVYGTTAELAAHGADFREILARLEKRDVYAIEFDCRRDGFTVTARHKTRPDTRPALVVDESGEVRTLPKP